MVKFGGKPTFLPVCKFAMKPLKQKNLRHAEANKKVHSVHSKSHRGREQQFFGRFGFPQELSFFPDGYRGFQTAQ